MLLCITAWDMRGWDVSRRVIDGMMISWLWLRVLLSMIRLLWLLFVAFSLCSWLIWEHTHLPSRLSSVHLPCFSFLMSKFDRYLPYLWCQEKPLRLNQFIYQHFRVSYINSYVKSNLLDFFMSKIFLWLQIKQAVPRSSPFGLRMKRCTMVHCCGQTSPAKAVHSCTNSLQILNLALARCPATPSYDSSH